MCKRNMFYILSYWKKRNLKVSDFYNKKIFEKKLNLFYNVKTVDYVPVIIQIMKY